MPNYIRYRLPVGCYFFTVNLAERRRALLVDHIEALRAAIRIVRRRHAFLIEAMVVLPDHLHAIFTPPPGDADFSMRWRLIKVGFSRALPATERRSVSRMSQGERGIWQRRFWEHAIRDDEDLRRHVEYIHYNPVKHGYVAAPVDWPHSSFHRFVQLGLYSTDWAQGNTDGVGSAFGEQEE